MGITKNTQSDKKIKELSKIAFPQKNVINIEELFGGMCNVAYKVSFNDNTIYILKISASTNEGYMRNEHNLMETEVEAMKIAKYNNIKFLADVVFFDNSYNHCSGKYFFMEFINGKNYYEEKSNLNHKENQIINKEIGLFEKKLSEITNNKFGIIASKNEFDNLYDFVYYLFDNLIKDAKDINLDFDINLNQLLKNLGESKSIFDEVKNPSLVHWDMWEGNIFIKNKHINGVIDWERAMWGDPFMDDRFRKHTINQDFLEGFGKPNLTENELKRIYWYDLFLYLTMSVEFFYRGYEDKSQYYWAKAEFEELLKNSK